MPSVLPDGGALANMVLLMVAARRRPPWFTISVLLLAGCQSGPPETKPVSQPESFEDPAVLAAHRARLTELDRLFLGNAPGYSTERARLVEQEPRTAAWLAKAMVGYAVRDHDALQKEGYAPVQVEGRKDFADRELFRARRELVELGPAGRTAILHYLLGSPRKELRDIGSYLWRAQPGDAAVGDLVRVAGGSEAIAAREAVRLLADSPRDQRARAALEAAVRSSDWQLRGTAVRSLARAQAAAGDGAAGWLWQVARDDGDAWVRQQALAGLGELADQSLVPPLVDELEKLLRAGRGREAEGAAEALRRLTGAPYGTEVGKWRSWLAGRGR